ncbi:hypothetical protein [Helicobacter aurati]|uniref:hypothetical protein n=1 Tax=Helicobacter aurati TaxID=137778 RepID=UPI000CF03D93|nr:hypothetical protein [Helicobacter aurati]
MYVFIYLQLSFAARPLNTDDADIIRKNHCQVETWVNVGQNDTSELWAVPTCNLFWNTEVSLGGMIGIETNILQFQIKKLFVDIKQKGWGIALTIGNTYIHWINNNKINNNEGNNTHFNIPVSIELWKSRIIGHISMGFNILNFNFKHSTITLGAGLETFVLPDSLSLLGEIYWIRAFDNVLYQIGVQTWLVKNILQINLTYGNDFSGQNHFVSLGFRILSAKLF